MSGLIAGLRKVKDAANDQLTGARQTADITFSRFRAPAPKNVALTTDCHRLFQMRVNPQR